MKTELLDVNETRKNLRIEIPQDIVDAEIERIARDYSRRARIPGFRPGKAPARVIKQRYKDQILHDVAHDLIPRAVDNALRERGVEAVDTPDIRDVTVEEGRPLTFTAAFDTVPSFEPGDYSTIALRRPSARVEDEAVNIALQRLRDRAARFDPVEGRGVDHGDTVVADLVRRELGGRVSEQAPGPRTETRPPDAKPDRHTDVNIELGAKANPTGFDEQLLGLDVGATKSFATHYPADYPIGELAGTDVSYTVTVKAIKRRVLPDLDDEFAKDLGEFETLDALRGELMKQLAARVPFEVPASLIDRELDRRTEEFARRLIEQNIDPRQAGIDWDAFRNSQRDVAREAVAGAIVLDEVAHREHLDVTPEETEREISRYAERSGRTPAAVRARLEKEGGLSRIAASLRREKSIDFLLARATISPEA